MIASNGIKTYSKLISIPSFEDRLKYLCLYGNVAIQTFGSHRYLNQILYHSKDWRSIRNDIIIRDDGCDLAHCDFPLGSRNIVIHHLNPITIDDVRERRDRVFDPENLVCCSYNVHQFIHYGVTDPKQEVYQERRENDTCPWK